MNRRHCLKTGAFAGIALGFGISSSHAASGMLGKMGPDEWKKANEAAGAGVKALSAGSAKLSEDDGELLKEIAAAGMMQLKLSEVAASMGSSEDVKMIAKAEVEEQTIVGAKVKEIAAAGGATLPEGPDEDTREAVEKLKGMKGLELDKHYLEVSGVDGHEKLEDIMEKVQSKAESDVLKKLAGATLPIIKTHLQVSKDEASDMEKAGN
jgi:putative membrane protein